MNNFLDTHPKKKNIKSFKIVWDTSGKWKQRQDERKLGSKTTEELTLDETKWTPGIHAV